MTPAQLRTIYGWLVVLTLIVGGQLLAPLVKWDGKITIGWPSLVAPAAKVTAVVYVYEKDDGSPPPAVLAALDKLNRQGILATTFEEDTLGGSGEVPEQYKTPLAEARKSGLPSLVVMAGDRFLLAKKAPKSEAEVLEAAK